MQSERGENKIFATLQELEKRSSEAEEIAREVGEVVGRVSPYTESQAGTEGGELRILIEVDKYIQLKRHLAQPGAVLAAVDLATLDVVSLKVIGVTRLDFYSMMGVREALTPYPIVHDPRGLLAKPQLLVEPLLAFRFDNGKLLEGTAAGYVIEPRSPVVLPKPEYLETLTGIKGEVVLGALTIGEEPVTSERGVARALLPFDDLFYHTLIVGTTGSGKTTFVKNLIKSLLYLNRGAAVVCIDENGDYVQTIFDPRWDIENEEVKRKEERLAMQLYGDIEGLKEINVLVPVTKHFIEETKVTTLDELAVEYYERSLKKLHEQASQSAEVEFRCEIEENTPVLVLTIVKPNGMEEYRRVRIIPYALNFNTVKEHIAELYPYFTPRARDALPKIIKIFTTDEIKNLLEKIQSESRMFSLKDKDKISKVSSLEDLVTILDKIQEIRRGIEILAEKVKVFESTLRNIIYGLDKLYETGIFDVKVGDTVIEEPDVGEFIKEGCLTVLDLRPLVTRGAKRIVSLRLLSNVLEWKMRSEFKQRTPPTIVLVDEAHRFFPRAAEAEERDYVEYVSGALDRLARLGRVRGLGLILSTHSPKDVHSAVLNLCNNKVVFRLEPSLAEELGLPRELKDFVSKASDRVGIVTSHALRLHYATFKTPPPVLGHFKVRG